MKNKLILLLIFFAINFNFIFSQDDLGIIKKIKDNKKLIVSILNKDKYPFYFTENNKIKGYDILLCEKISNALNVGLEIDNSSNTFNKLTQKIIFGQSHIAVSKIKRNLKDSLLLSYSKPYLKIGYVFLINRVKLADYKTIGDYLDVLAYHKSKISTLDNNLYKDYIKKYYPDNPVKLFNNEKELINDLLNGDSVAVFLDEIEAKLVFKNNKELAIKILYYKFEEIYDDLHIVTSWKNKFLIDYLNIFLNSRYQKLSLNEVINFNK